MTKPGFFQRWSPVVVLAIFLTLGIAAARWGGFW
jgi:hypothetical protein